MIYFYRHKFTFVFYEKRDDLGKLSLQLYPRTVSVRFQEFDSSVGVLVKAIFKKNCLILSWFLKGTLKIKHFHNDTHQVKFKLRIYFKEIAFGLKIKTYPHQSFMTAIVCCRLSSALMILIMFFFPQCIVGLNKKQTIFFRFQTLFKIQQM